ncbi:CSC1-like protein 1 [Hippoglossus stenolepis]|uniref:CSC1-like protein 1 n=1 Tax=Hippoglossus stenolepis TaxID=195615 RepID=UPI001FAFE1D6|nr:CSC1-like protein 1 [Hippoglossus stenolepis]
MVAANKRVMEEGQANENTPNEPTEAEQGFFSWIPFTINLSDEQIKAKSGQDAVHYLSLQRHLIFLLSIKSVISLSIIMPINWSGFLLSQELLLWVHPVFAVVYLILTVFVLINHTRQVKDRSKETTRNTLMYCSVPKTATEEEIKAHFTEAYPTCEVTAVTLGYDVTNILNLDQERIESGENLRYYEHVLEKTGKSKKINPCVCSHLCCCCNFQEVDAIEFYANKEQDLLQKMRNQLEKEQPRPLGMAFVTFKTNAMAKLVLKDFNAVKCHKFCCGRKPKSSSKSESLKVTNWRAEFASFARSIKWENLAVKGFKWTGQFLVVNLALLILVTFLTTPAMMVNTLDRFNVTTPITDLMIPIVSQFFPTLLLLVCSSLLPAIVHHSTDLESRWSSSSEQLSTMRKLYFFLIFMVLILPSLGLTSIAGLFQWLFQRLIHGVGTVRFACVFLPDHGVFVVNYVITAGFMGSVMILLRLPELLLYIIRLVFARSAAERKYIKQNQAYESAYGAMYGWTLCVFTICVAYSIICPIITPCGLLFVMIRHFVDKHNLYFAYLPNPLDSHVHMAAIDMVMVAPILCLMWLYFYFFDTAGFLSPIAMFTMVFLLIVVVVCITHKFFGYFKYLSPQNYKVKDKEEVAEEEQEVYLPRVLYPEAPVCAMILETNEAADNSLAIRTSPLWDVRFTDSVHFTDTDKLISET